MATAEYERLNDIVSMLRANARGERFDNFSFSELADRIEAAWERERRLIAAQPRTWEECVAKAKEAWDDCY